MSQFAMSAVQGPSGLKTCKADGPLEKILSRTASPYGTLQGCFISEEQVQIKGKDKVMKMPLEVAFAIAFLPHKTTSVTVADVNALYLKTANQWKNVDQTWPKNRSNYEKKLNAMVKNILSEKPSDPGTPLSVDEPVLVSMERLSPESYTVVSIRRRTVSMAGDHFITTKVEGSGIVVIQGQLMRLTITKELRKSSDIESVKASLASWVRSLPKTRALN